MGSAGAIALVNVAVWELVYLKVIPIAQQMAAQ